jgi:hypothetical protein
MQWTGTITVGSNTAMVTIPGPLEDHGSVLEAALVESSSRLSATR